MPLAGNSGTDGKGHGAENEMSSPRAVATESCPVEQPYRSPVGGRAFSLTARRALKRGALWAFCWHLVPAWLVTAVFRLFRLRGL